MHISGLYTRYIKTITLSECLEKKGAESLRYSRVNWLLMFLSASNTFTPFVYAQESGAEPLMLPLIIAVLGATIVPIILIVRIKRKDSVKLSVYDVSFLPILAKDFASAKTLGREPELIPRVENNISNVSLPSQHHHEPIKAETPA
jgi:hypothetical protein